jgi:hypothetical protein
MWLMKKAILIIAVASLLCLCIAGCSSNTDTASADNYAYVVGVSPDAAVTPSESYIIESLQQSEYVTVVEAVTKYNDPNDKLNTDGGYIACVYFSSTLVNQADFSSTNVLQNGTSCGGCIEVYANEEDAITRNNYLAKFDGGLFDSGSHTLIGTIVIRTSEKLSREQQVALTQNLISIITSGEQSASPGQQETLADDPTQNTTVATTPETTVPVTDPTTPSTTEPAHTHSFSAATCTAPKTCSCGATEGKARGHSWQDATCTAPKICTTCGERSGSAIQHNYVNGQCSTCGAKDPSYVSEALVWIPTHGGTKYHSKSSCSKMIDPIQVTISEAVSMGYGPCGRCY